MVTDSKYRMVELQLWFIFHCQNGMPYIVRRFQTIQISYLSRSIHIRHKENWSTIPSDHSYCSGLAGQSSASFPVSFPWVSIGFMFVWEFRPCLSPRELTAHSSPRSTAQWCFHSLLLLLLLFQFQHSKRKTPYKCVGFKTYSISKFHLSFYFPTAQYCLETGCY